MKQKVSLFSGFMDNDYLSGNITNCVQAYIQYMCK